MRPTFYFTATTNTGTSRYPVSGTYEITNEDFARAEADLASRLSNRALSMFICTPEYDDDQVSNLIMLMFKSIKHLRWIAGSEHSTIPRDSVWRYRGQGDMNLAEAVRRVFERCPDVGSYTVSNRTLELKLLSATATLDTIIAFARRVCNLAEWPLTNTDTKLSSLTGFKWQTFDAISKFRQRGIPPRNPETPERPARAEAPSSRQIEEEIEEEDEEQDPDED